jgi:hypothetical protein
VLQRLHHTISAERLTRYLVATKGDLRYAIRLYEINIQISQTFYGVLHGYEIAFRNAMHERLTERFGRTDWYAQAELQPVHQNMISKAKADATRAHRSGSTVPVGKVVAELGLGFWTGLVAAHYEQALWKTCLRKAFPCMRLSRKEAYPLLSDIKSVRNRVAHHERILGSKGALYAGLHPIHRTELTLRPEAILECVGWICPTTSGWIRKATKFEDCLLLLNSPEVKKIGF